MKKSSLKNTFVSTTFIILLSSLVLTSCKKDNMETLQEPETEFSIPEYHPIITEGCDPLNHVIDTMDFPYIDIDQLIGGGAAAGEKEKSIWASLGIFLLQQGGGALVSVFTKPLVNMLSTAIFGGDHTSEKLDMVLDKLSVIEQDMNTLMTMTQQALSAIDNLHYTSLYRYYTDFQSILTSLKDANDLCVDRLGLIESNAQNLDSNELDQQIWQVMHDWGGTHVSCGDAYLALDQICNVYLFQPGPEYNYQSRNMFAIYDVVVFHNTPWEKTGYDIRDMFRAAVAAETLRTAWLTALYYRSLFNNGQISQNLLNGKLNDIKTILNGLNTLFSNNTVERHPNVVRCQLHDALFTLDADALEEHKGWTFTKNNAYYPLNGTKHVFSQGTITSTSNDANITAARNSQLTNSQISQITTYYKTKFGENYTILNCLEDGGLIVPSYYNTIFTYLDGHSNDFEEVYLLSQETTMNFYLTSESINQANTLYQNFPIRKDILLRLSGLYNVGIPLSCTEAAGFSCHGYLPDFHKDSFYCEDLNSKLYGTAPEEFIQNLEYFDNPITVNGVTYIARLNKWHARKGYTYTFPDKYVLWFKTGSLQLYDYSNI